MIGLQAQKNGSSEESKEVGDLRDELEAALEIIEDLREDKKDLKHQLSVFVVESDRALVSLQKQVRLLFDDFWFIPKECGENQTLESMQQQEDFFFNAVLVLFRNVARPE